MGIKLRYAVAVGILTALFGMLGPVSAQASLAHATSVPAVSHNSGIVSRTLAPANRCGHYGDCGGHGHCGYYGCGGGHGHCGYYGCGGGYHHCGYYGCGGGHYHCGYYGCGGGHHHCGYYGCYGHHEHYSYGRYG